MAQAAIKTVNKAGALPAADVAIDREHLARMTFGDRNLERELLELFDRQAAILLARMTSSDAASISTMWSAHWSGSSSVKPPVPPSRHSTPSGRFSCSSMRTT